MNISESFTSQEFAAALKHLKPGKAPGPDSICPELITHAGAALKSWLCGFLFSCLRHLKIQKILEKSTDSGDPQTQEACRGPENLSSHLLALRSLQDSRVAHTRS